MYSVCLTGPMAPSDQMRWRAQFDAFEPFMPDDFYDVGRGLRGTRCSRIHLSSGEAVLGLHGRRERLACVDRPYGPRGRTACPILTYWVGVLQDVLAA